MMRRTGLFFLLLGLLAFLAPVGAHAGTPTCNAHPNCNMPLPPCSGVCNYNGGTNTWDCDVSGGFGIAGSNATVVADFQVSGSTYCNTGWDYAAWGQVRGGAAFFCTHDDNDAGSEVTRIELTGSPNGDDLCFEETTGTFELTLSSGAYASTLDADMFGGNGDDEMEGSDSTDSDYAETLCGEGGDDDMYGRDGDDDMDGEAGQDLMYGGGGADSMSGGVYADTLYGESGDDVMCGQSGDDSLYGGDNDDILDGGGDAMDYENGGNHTDECRGSGTAISCTAPITSSYSCFTCG